MKQCSIDSLFVDKSRIQGNGIFSKDQIRKGSLVIPHMFEYKYDGNHLLKDKSYYLRSDACRLMNHQYPPNCVPKKHENIIYAVASRDIQPGEEVSIDYFDVINTLQPQAKKLSDFPFIKKDIIRIMPSIKKDLLVDNLHKTYMDDLVTFALNDIGHPDSVKSFLDIIKL
jgi:hypothetical protein